MDQSSRTATLDSFRAGELALLAASDVAARGLDIPDVSHIFNFDVPIHSEDYVHRIGRTGRAGRSGFAATLVSDYELRALDDIKKLVKVECEWLGEPPPTEAYDRGLKRGRRRPAAPPPSRRDGPRDREQPAKGAGDRAGASRSSAASRATAAGRGTASRARPNRLRIRALIAIVRTGCANDRFAKAIRGSSATTGRSVERHGPDVGSAGRPGRPGGERRYRPSDDGPSPVGLGDHVPDFLKRQVKLTSE